jgi:methyl-accepting chemotaxis protein
MRDLGEALNATAENLHDFRLSVASAKGEAEKERDEARRALAEAGQARERAERAKAEGMVHAAGQLEQVVAVVSGASAELTAQIEQSRRDTDLQSQRAGETATAMAQMNATVLEVARNAASAAESAAAARARALDGAQVVSQVIGEIHAMQQVSETMKTDMGQLGRQAEGIGQIINVISDIADQTNLLALNAAIEAARAGDAGRGFAVVADEVRKLAEKTMVATKEVSDAVNAIQTGARRNLKTVDQVVSTVEAATRLARRSGEALGGIVELVEVSSDQVRNIATASDQQSATSDEINRSIEEMSHIAGSTARAMNESARAVEDLSGQTLGLRALIEKMKSPD